MTAEPKIAQTWEECAQHVEAGGVVQYLYGDDVWLDESLSAGAYRGLSRAPGEYGWHRPRRLMPIAATEPGPKIATTWEECARHVEAGGVVQRYCDDMWMDESLPVTAYRGSTGTPGRDWCHPRRLMPIAAPATPAGMTPGPEVDGRPTWYGTARDAKVAGMDETRAWMCDGWSYVNRWTSDEIVQARYPLPKPKTERVYWWEAVGRTDPHDGEIIRVEKVAGWKPLVHFVDSAHMVVESPDGTVEVLAEDDES